MTASMRRPGRVTVVGSLNLDRTLSVPQLPAPGATVHARSEIMGPGGKGANQAVAAAKMGAHVTLVGAVGDDDAARLVLHAVTQAGVDATHVTTTSGPTGSATVMVDDAGENMIVVLPGANAQLRPPPEGLAATVRDAEVLLLQLETPIGTQLDAARAARGTVILNPAPMPDPAELDDLLGAVDLLVPNRTELAALVGLPGDADPDDLLAAGQRLVTPHLTLVVTLGAEGAVILTADAMTRVASPAVDAVDSTGAGDMFCGTVAAALARGEDLPTAVREAAAAAAITVTRPGAQVSFPDRREVGNSHQSPTT